MEGRRGTSFRAQTLGLWLLLVGCVATSTGYDADAEFEVLDQLMRNLQVDPGCVTTQGE